ncbi:YcgN family cysteine cluster protein [Polycladidibacter stylochi]|uniref:YcgN family cysteine cluster protein n=1 Tax=Polycladidibacter stylochi TaxID=1807766 RepID=UPI00082E7B4F|nr:YcgN family cysteine cluster protein [Pseudovibrio stylochi]
MVTKKNTDPLPFYKAKALEQMSLSEWESLCDGCGRCCLNKLEDWDTGEIHWTYVACTLLDGNTCRCKNYEDRFNFVPDCVQLTPKVVRELKWLPPTCAYRLIKEGKELYWWHPLVSGDPQTVHHAGVSVQDKTVTEDGLEPEDYEDFLVSWPNEDLPEDID